MRIGDLSRRTGISVRMLRYYEAEGLLVPRRTGAGYRDFEPDDEATVDQIKLLGGAGMTLAVIREFLPCALDARGAFEPCFELQARVRDHIARVDDDIDRLKNSRRALEEILKRLTYALPGKAS